MTVHRFGEASIAALGGGVVTEARSRRANSVNGMRHLVVVMPNRSDEEHQRKSALCGFRPTRKSGWVFNPSWPDRRCMTCLIREHL